MQRVGDIIFLILMFSVAPAMAATFEIFHDPLPSTWASFDFDTDGDKLACNYGGHLFLWSPEDGFQDLGDGHPQSGSISISADGTTICATRIRPEDGYLNPALWSAAKGWTDLGHTLDGLVKDGSWGSGFDLSNNGREAVGLAWTSQGAQAFRWTIKGGMTRLACRESDGTSRATAISDNGSLIVGFLEHSQHGYRLPVCWNTDHPDTLQYYAGHEVRGEALNVNSDGTIIVGYHLSNQVEQAHFWTQAEGLVPLGNLSQLSWDPSRATHITDKGSILGTSTSSTLNITEAFFWDAFDGMVRLQDLLEDQGAIIPNSLWIDEVLAISDDATTLIGSWRNARGQQGHWMAHPDTPQKGKIRKCMASLDGTRLQLEFDLALPDSALRPVLTASRKGQKWNIPLGFNQLSCQGTDHHANLYQSEEVVYELTIEKINQSMVLERFAIWADNSQEEERSLLGSLLLPSPRSPKLNIRIQKTNNRIPRDMPIYQGSGQEPGQYIHIQWQ